MFDIGFWELVLIGVVALVVVGPERLPRLIRVTGLWVGRANASFQSIKNEIAREMRAEELKQALKETRDDLPDANQILSPDSGKQQTEESKTDSSEKDKDGNG